MTSLKMNSTAHVAICINSINTSRGNVGGLSTSSTRAVAQTFMVSAKETLVKRLLMSNNQRKTDGLKSVVLTMLAKVKKFDIQLPQ